jgi:anhydro-N-acetylmuramic acid kinase
MLSIGLMSGTSMDGIDAALLETDGTSALIKELGHFSLPYHPLFKIQLKIAEYAVRQSAGDVNRAKEYYPQAIRDYLRNELHTSEEIIEYHPNILSGMNFDEIISHSTYLHGVAVQELLKNTKHLAQEIAVVGYHGQTFYHQPQKKISLILGDGQALANQIGITVINDFRRQDIEAGGQGAPFAPLYHHALAMRDHKIPLVVVNCGGIANVTLIQNANELEVLGFDTGPGNGLIDRLVKQRTQGQENMDSDGHYGSKGIVNETVLNVLFEKSVMKDGQNYFSKPLPKSLDIGDMILIPELDALSIEDACRTLEAFTAQSIIQSINTLVDSPPEHWILAGGGWNNPVILQELKSELIETFGKDICIQTADEAGWNSQAMEAQIFAYFAVRSLQGKPLSVPGTTGVTKPMTGGQSYFPIKPS